MKISISLNGKSRKELVCAVDRELGAKPVYRGAPSFAYDIGCMSVDAEGVLTVPETIDKGSVHVLLDALALCGFVGSVPSEGYAIEIPTDGFDEQAYANLTALIRAKEALIIKALGAHSLEIERFDDRLRFSWFDACLSTSEVSAYCSFLTALCEQAKKQSRVTARASGNENEKYAFRCFLLKLGFIGDEYKDDRKVLLSRLSGNSAFKSGKPKAE